MSDGLREKYEQEYLQMAEFALWKRIVDYVEGMADAMVHDIGETGDYNKFLAWKGELSGIKRVLSFLKEPLKKLADKE